MLSLKKDSHSQTLVDFDALYGHRRNAHGYRDCLHEFDERLPEIIAAMRENDLLLITADHGNDPTYAGTDHTREYIPLLAYSPAFKGNGLLPVGHFADILSDYLQITLVLKLP